MNLAHIIWSRRGPAARRLSAASVLRALSLWALALTFGATGAPAQSPPPSLRIKVVTVCRSLDRWNNPVGEVKENPLSAGPVVVWLVVSGDATALNWLREQRRRFGSQVVTHDWVRYAGASVQEAPPVRAEADRNEIAAGTIRYFDNLAGSMRAGLFDWRTWSIKRNFEPGQYEVRVRVGQHYLKNENGDEVLARFDFEN
ncbi:MAG: hypothetical protein JSR82_07545 [Verrucomicrobia bacterium]|nr:hypothetical protein [Verrucomicrobiota bacterium]